MNQYNSYYLYQQYEKRGDQDWLPSYPNIFSVDGDGTMPLVMKTENDPDCGYVPPAEPIYRWYSLPIYADYICDECPAVQYRWLDINISEDYVCVGTDKHYKQKRQYSYDSGTTWNDVTPPETQTGSLYQTGSTDCGYVPPIEPQYRTTSGTPYCEGYDKYVDVYSQVSYDGGSTWETTATTPTLIEAQSTDCGYVPPTPSYSGSYLTFEAIDDCTFKLSGSSFSYSLDGGATWANTSYNSYTPTVSAGNSIMLKREYFAIQDGGIGTFTSTGRFNANGNLMSMAYGDNFAGETDLTGKNSAFAHLFSGCTNLISAENLILPATTLSYRCYYNMFSNCTSLTTAPSILPATTLSDSCYYGMFYNCTSLTTTPELPATTLADACYGSMFYDCSSLTTAPSVLPATTLSDSCYFYMFRNCTSLTTAPSLSATTLASYCCYGMFCGCTGLVTAPALPVTTLIYACYCQMFSGCTSLTTAPDLPAPTLAGYCYSSMFRDCTSLNYIKCLATNISADSCTTNWLNGVASRGTFIKSASITTSSWGRGVSGIPRNWTVQDAT